MELFPDVFLTILDTDRFRTNYLSLNILRPLRQEEAAMNALLPDVLLRGCRICPDMREISVWLDQRYGAGVQPTVRKKGEVQAVGFFFDYVSERYAAPEEDLTADICALLGSFLLEPVLEDGAFRGDYVEGEKVNLCNAIMAQINDKRVYAALRLRQEMFAGEAYGVGKNGEKEQVEQITIALIYKFMDDMDLQAAEFGGVRAFFKGEYEKYDGGSFGLDRDMELPPSCRCGEVIVGRIDPGECPMFGKGCTPMAPYGPCMVSAEGACGIWFRNR